MILVIDNYDSFVFNLARYVREAGYAVTVVRNDAFTLADIAAWQPSHIIISPGPRTPDEAGMSVRVIRQFGAHIPMLGVCLGHQAIARAYGGRIVRASSPVHGMASQIVHDGSGIFAGLENPLSVGRYHSLMVSAENFPSVLRVTARLKTGEIMALQHVLFPVYGVQFHPESILTPAGRRIVSHFLQLTGLAQGEKNESRVATNRNRPAGAGALSTTPAL